MDSAILRAGHAQLACEVNPEVGDQQQEPTEVIQPSDNASLDAVGIPLALARGRMSIFGTQAVLVLSGRAFSVWPIWFRGLKTGKLRTAPVLIPNFMSAFGSQICSFTML